MPFTSSVFLLPSVGTILLWKGKKYILGFTVEINLPCYSPTRCMCMREGGDSVRGKKNVYTKDTGTAVTWSRSTATDLEEIGRLYPYQQSLQKASHGNYHLQLGSTTNLTTLVNDA